MTWKPVTESAYDPNPANDGIPFVLTPSERDVAKVASLELERNRRRQNEREMRWALRNAVQQPEPPEAA